MVLIFALFFVLYVMMNKNMENFTTTDEAVQNISSLFNKGKITVTDLDVTGTLNVAGNAQISGSATINNSLTANNAKIGNIASNSYLTVEQNGDILTNNIRSFGNIYLAEHGGQSLVFQNFGIATPDGKNLTAFDSTTGQALWLVVGSAGGSEFHTPNGLAANIGGWNVKSNGMATLPGPPPS